MKLLESQVAVVTGAGSGIGRAIACGFAQQGARLVIADIDADAATATAQTITDGGGKAHPVALDVTDRAACATLAGRIADEMGRVSILVNNAAIVRRDEMSGPAEAVVRDWQDILAVNLTGVFNVTHALLEPLRSSRGRIINIGSIQSFVHVRTPLSPAYTATKHGVLGFTRALAAELGKEGVRVNMIAPGFTETNLNATLRANHPERVAVLLGHVPLGRAAKPEDYIGPAVFLASEMSAYVTGSTLMVDGGYCAI
jgi:3-oxoacyl-[acyl-carrier protein] reductase